MRRIKNSLDESYKFKYFFIEKEEQQYINFKWMVPRIRDLYRQHAKYDYFPKLKIFVMMIKPN